MSYPKWFTVRGVHWPSGLKTDAVKHLRDARRAELKFHKENTPMRVIQARLEDQQITLHTEVVRGDEYDCISLDIDEWNGLDYTYGGYIDIWGWKEVEK